MKKINYQKWLDEWILAGRGIILATKERYFWLGFVPAFIFFGTLINLLSGGTGKFQLMAAVGFPQCLEIVWSSIIGVFGINMIFMEWVPVFLLSLMQATLIGLIVLLLRKKRQPAKKSTGQATGESNIDTSGKTKDSTAESVERAGIITGLIALGAGCPTCGATLITPLIGTIFSTGGLAVAGTISTLVTIIAVIIALLSLKRIGVESYVIIINEKYLKKRS
ncbi:hypothetical protein IJ135_02745 [Candidatus Saccharibacteria bacterium]|nr:hypothetical protein [Candidatus Saccharibacteria bacterium]